MPSVAGIVRSDDRILLVQGTDGRWSTPGGSMELEDTPANAVVREVWEETGLFVRPTRLMSVYGGPEFVVRYPHGDETQYVSAMFECEVISGEVRADGEEIQRAHFWTYEDAARLTLSPWLHRVLHRLYDREETPWFEPPTWTPDR
jgi:ADP-ribose pyrophosphatase YjhB (NUDIX family)